MEPPSGPERKLQTSSKAMEPSSGRLAELQPKLQTGSRAMEPPSGPEPKFQTGSNHSKHDEDMKFDDEKTKNAKHDEIVKF